MTTQSYQKNDLPRRLRTLTAAAFWLAVITAGAAGSGWAGPSETSQNQGSMNMTTTTAPPSAYATATFAMG